MLNDDIKQFTASAPKPYGRYGCKHITLSNQETSLPAKIKVAELTLPPFGVNQFGSSTSLLFNLTEPLKHALYDFTEVLIDTAIISCDVWFDDALLSESEIRERMSPLFRDGKAKTDGTTWPGTMRVTPGKNCQSAAVLDLGGKTLVDVVIDCSTLYTNKEKWGVKFTLESYRIKVQDKLAKSRSPENRKRPSPEWVPDSPEITPKRVSRVTNIPPMPKLKRQTAMVPDQECFGCVNLRPSQRDHQGENGCCNLDD
jgi:hypothetical protein